MVALLYFLGMFACALFFYFAASMENREVWKWPLLSVIVWIITPTFGWSILAKFAGQVLLFFGIAFYRAWVDYERARFMNPRYPS